MPPGSCGNSVRERVSHARMSLHLDGHSVASPFTRLLSASKMILLQVSDWSVEKRYQNSVSPSAGLPSGPGFLLGQSHHKLSVLYDSCMIAYRHYNIDRHLWLQNVATDFTVPILEFPASCSDG